MRLVKFGSGPLELQGAHKLCILSNGSRRVIGPAISRNRQHVHNNRSQGIFQDLEHGVSTNPWGSLPFPSPLPSLSPSLPFPSLPPFALKPGDVVRKLGGINPPPPEGVGNSLVAVRRKRKKYGLSDDVALLGIIVLHFRYLLFT